MDAIPDTKGSVAPMGPTPPTEGPTPEDHGRTVRVAPTKDGRYRVSVCAGTACTFAGSTAVYEAFARKVEAAGLGDRVEVSIVGCHGLCTMSPVVVLSDDTLYGHLRTEDVNTVVLQHLVDGIPVEGLLYRDPSTGEPVRSWRDIEFYKQQTRIALRNVGQINPESIEEYVARGGYEAARMVLTEKTPEWVIAQVTDSGVRGRGGAGFATGVKWELAKKSRSDVKYIICNGDEGDPGAFMDASIMDGDPHSVIEGMIIGSYAIGAHEGYIYVRAEYPLAVRRLTKAIADAEAAGYLGDDAMGSGWAFRLKLKLGAGAFVCGEETALIASIEGRRGMPRPRPPYPAVSGLWGKPTNINNVETFANISWIVTHGAEAYSDLGVSGCHGTKAFSLAGKLVNGGLAEIPMGVTLRHVIYDIGGGIRDGRQFKAVQMGGPSGGCVPASMLDTPVDYESLAATGAMVGSGGIVAVDDQTCMVDMARFFLHFTQSESCGKCIPCRLGTKRMLDVLDRIVAGEGREGDVEFLEEMSAYVSEGSLCALGGTAPNPVLTTIKYFRREYEAHVHEKRCPAGTCKALIRYTIDPDACTGCTLCAKKCPVGCISGERKQLHVIDQRACIKCDTCRQVCKFDAVRVLSGVEEPAPTVGRGA
jgi:NADH:ubiquinone oxidoreductase subunit F (NADH-binding)/(2Fe-2S) ferredoxin/Pyruvate/2-oxoacid:ferredoxin oxidoreductase delta subunit